MNRTLAALAKRARTMTDAELQRAYEAPCPARIPSMRHARRCDVYLAEMSARRTARDVARLAEIAGDYAAIKAEFMKDGSTVFYDAMVALEAAA